MKTYFNSERNIALLSKPSGAIGLFLMVLFVCLLGNIANGATITSTSGGGNWNSTDSWVGGVVPTATDDVVIASGAIITLDGARSAKTLDIRGTLLFNANNTSVTLPSNGTVHIVSPGSVTNSGSCTNNRQIIIGGAQYAACTGGGPGVNSFTDLNTSAGNCPTSAGTITGNQYICRYGSMTTTFTSTVSGGVWSSSNTAIASVNASTGVVTSTKPDDGVSRTVTITYTVGGTGGCTSYTATRDVYVANGPAAGPNSLTGSQTQCQGTTTTYTITPDPYSYSYVWAYEGTGATITPSADGLSASVTFSSTATSGNMRVQSVNGCGNGGGGKYLYVTINSAISTTKPTANNVSGTCGYAQLSWTTVSNAIGYYLDIATDSGFTNFVAGFNNYKGTYNGAYNFTGLPNGTLYYRIRAYDNCVISNSSDTKTITMVNVVPGTVSSSQTICSGTSPSDLTLSGNSSPVQYWQKSNDAAFTSPSSISVTSTTLTGATIGNLTQNTYFRAYTKMNASPWCDGYSTSVLITVNNTVSAASSTPTVCYNTAITPITHTVIGFSGIGMVTGLPTGVTPSLSGNTLTISGTPTASGTFNYTIQLTGGSCGAGTANATGTITVRSVFTSGTISNTGETICINTVPAVTIGNTTSAGGGDTAITYQWQYSTDSTFATGVTTLNNNAATYKPTQSLTQTTYYRRQAKDGTCNTTFSSSVNIWTVTVNARPVPTYTVQPGTSSCAGTDLTYTTQSGMSNYIWTVPGTLNTDYSITSGGVGTASNTVTLKWLTSGSKTVTVNYTSVCAGSSAASNTTTVGDLPNNVSNGFSASTICAGGSPQLTFDAVDAAFSSPYSITYRNDATLAQYTIAIPSASAYSFTPGDNPTSNANYSLVSISNANCTRTSSFGNSGANLIIRPLPTASISGTTAVCAGALSPNITFTNPQTVAVTVTYKINGGADQTVNIAASSSSNVAVSTAASGSFVYSLVSVIYQSTPACSNTLSGSATVNVNSLSTAPTAITGTTTICNGSSTTLTLSGGAAGTGAVAEWFAGSCGGAPIGTGNSITVSPSSNTTYYVRYSGTCNTTICASQLVTVNTPSAAPTAITGTTTICNGSSTTLTLSGGAAGTGAVAEWFAGSCGGTPIGTGNSIAVSPSSNTTYYVRYSGTCNTTICASQLVTVNTPSTAPTAITGTTTICNGSSTTLALSGGAAGTGAVAEWFAGSCGGTPIGTGNSIAVSPASNTTYYVRYSGACNTTVCASQLVTVNPFPAAAGTITGPVNVCQGQVNVGYSVPAIANAVSYSWSYSGTGATITNGTTNTPVITFASNAASGNLTVYGINSCGNGVSANYAITVNTLTAVPTVGAVTQPTCVYAAGSVVLSGLPASGTVFQTGTATASYTITGTTMTISGLAAGIYQFSAAEGTCPSASTGNVVISLSGTKTWNGSAWSPDAPTSSDMAVINGNYSTSSNNDLNACSVIINSGFTLTIEADHFVTIQNNLTVNGTLSILDKGSLVMVNDAGIVNGTGTSIVRRMTTPYKKSDYVYWSTPVSTAAISSASTGTFPGWKTSYAYQYNNAWVKATTMTPAKGYIVMVPDPTSAPGGNISSAVFKGTVNNGIKKITGIAADKSYLLGNPYPSAIDADQFILQNSGVVGGTVYFWTHNTAIQLASNITNGTAGSGAYAYTSDDYASYNITGGTGTASAKSGGVVPNGKIGTGQGFFTTSKVSISSTEFVFNNSMRVGAGSGAGANTQFFKTKNPNSSKTAAGIEKHRLWLNLSNAQGAFKQTLLGYIGGATNGNDELYDGKTLDGNKYIDFYSVNQNSNLVIQGRALPFDDKDEVPLGYKTGVEGSFTINIEKTDGLLVNQAVFLQDKLTNTEFDLKSGSYTFTTAKGTFNDRFVLKYKSAKTLGTDAFDLQGDQVLVSVKDKLIKITSSVETIAKVLIYDISGKQIYKNEHIKSNEFTAADFTAADQVLIVKTTLENGAVTTDKVVF